MQLIDPLSISLEQIKFRKQAVLSILGNIVLFLFTLFYASIFKNSLELILTLNILAFGFGVALFINTFSSQKISVELAHANSLIQFSFNFSYFLIFILHFLQ